MSPISQLLPVIVLYRCDLQDSMTWKTLIAPWRSLQALIVIDNSPESQQLPAEMGGKHIFYHHFPNNPGLSFGYNFAAAEAEKLGYSHLLLLDQDSDFPEDAGIHYEQKLIDNPQIDAVSLYVLGGYMFFSPCLFKEGESTKHFPNITLLAETYPFNEVSVINSGLMIRLEPFKQSGGYTERIALDWSDISFCFKLGKLGLNVEILPLIMRQGWSILEKKNKQTTLSRYRYLCRGGRFLAAEAHNFWPLTRIVFLNGAKQTLRFKNPIFLWYFLRHYLLLRT